MLTAAVAAVLSVGVSSVAALNNGQALSPQMGWNSWNKFACNVSDTLIRETADAMVSSGLAAVGYSYINIDDCWQVSRDATGKIVADPVAFPNGIAALAEYVHSKGLKFGLYSDAGLYTCQLRPGGLGHETIDAQTYAEWQVDYLKYDNCWNNNIKPEVRYPPMRDALNATGWPILFSMCEWGVDNPSSWAPDVANSWRTTADIWNDWTSMLSNIDANDASWSVAAPGQWNDPDMLEVGNAGMSTVEYTSHFSLWALSKSPLILGCDLRELDDATMKIISNTEVIEISQDPLAVQGHKIVAAPTGVEVWAGPLANGDTAVLLLNRGVSDVESFTLQWSQLQSELPGVDDCNTVRDLWQHQELGQFIGSFNSTQLPSHASQFLKITPCNKKQQPSSKLERRVAEE